MDENWNPGWARKELDRSMAESLVLPASVRPPMRLKEQTTYSLILAKRKLEERLAEIDGELSTRDTLGL